MSGLFYNLAAAAGGVPQLVILADDYDDLVLQYPTGPTGLGQLAYVSNEQGTKWLPGSMGGDYYGKGIYEWNGSVWEEANDEIHNQLQINIDNIATNATNIAGKLDSVVAGTNITVDNTDPNNPIISVSGSVGDMLKSVYDTDDNGVVDNSELLQGNDSAYHLDRANHTGTQTASTISDFDAEVSNNPDVVANTAKVSADGSVTTHSDVDITSPTTGQYLIYNGSDWVNETVSADQFNVDLDSAEASVTRVVSGGRTTFTVTHSLNTLDLIAQVFRLSDGRGINWRIERTGVNTIEASRAGTVADGQFRILIQR